MSDELPAVPSSDDQVEAIRNELAAAVSSRRRRITEKFVIAAIGVIPWVGAYIAAAAELKGEEEAARADDLRTKWLEEHETKFAELRTTISTISDRFEAFRASGMEEVEQRVQSPEYLSLVRQSFRVWDNAETAEKRKFVGNLVTNSAGTRVCSDDVVRLFITWLDQYHESHFRVIYEILHNPGSTRYDMWAGVYGEGDVPRDDSPEADMYKMLIRDLSTGGVIRQTRGINEAGQFVRKRPAKRRGSVAPSTMKSAFDDAEKYVLTEMGKQFVHYTMNEAVRRLST